MLIRALFRLFVCLRAGVPAGSRFVSVHFDGLNGQVVTARPIVTQLDAHAYLLTMMSEKWDAANAQIGQEVANAASWVNSFFVLMQYIDGLSLVRAKKVAPADPWSVFEVRASTNGVCPAHVLVWSWRTAD
jgi:hypothetical protein